MAIEEVYVNMMVDTLERKKAILQQILHQTKEQETLLKDEEMDVDAFQRILDLKGEEIEKLNQLDEGFDTLFHHVEKEINENRMAYKSRIRKMQKLINEVSEMGIRIQALEHQNSGHFKIYLANQKQVVKKFHTNNRTAANYYQNMANAHKPGSSYFFNETK
ncbi:MAG TPA: hypothetical protein DEO89_09435 [Lachnospiraceae bacterium]|nr:hypothetical protein [Lachnospiraceae bacterium]